ncbi:hypothetical protein Dda_3143 [Drechslerella dactyloides]|uniref:Mating-type protein MAT-1 n=1 Tax=Drechslerella dactyloides TaxID=74499 RepID=A0AAD6J583_DREDA|nr:hypothetical protein Dda_3143 [Drechslerella dactyloides]
MKPTIPHIPTFTVILLHLLSPTAAFLYGIVRGDANGNLPPRVDKVDSVGEANCFSVLAQKSGQLPRLPNTNFDRMIRGPYNVAHTSARPVDKRPLKYLAVANWSGSAQVQAMKLYSSEGCEAGNLVMIIRWYSRLNVIQIADLIDSSYLDIMPTRIQSLQPITTIAPVTSDDPETEAEAIDFTAEVIDNPDIMKPGSVYIPSIPNNGNDNTAPQYCDGIVQINQGVKSTMEALSSLSEENQSDGASQINWLVTYLKRLLSFLAPGGQKPPSGRKPKGLDTLQFTCTPLLQMAYVLFPGQEESLVADLPVGTVEAVEAGVQAAPANIPNEQTLRLNVDAGSLNDMSGQQLGDVGTAVSSELQPPRRTRGRKKKTTEQSGEQQQVPKRGPRARNLREKNNVNILQELESIVNPPKKNLKTDAPTLQPGSFWETMLQQQQQQQQPYGSVEGGYGLFEPGWSLLNFNPLGDPTEPTLPTLFDLNVDNENPLGAFGNHLDPVLAEYLRMMPAETFDAFGAGGDGVEVKEEVEVKLEPNAQAQAGMQAEAQAGGANADAEPDMKIEDEMF